MKKFTGLILLFVFSPIAFAARPLSTDDAGSVEKAHWELESGFEYADKADDEYTWTTTIKYGILETWDLGIEVPYQYLEVSEGDDVNGWGDIVICSKVRFLNETMDFTAFALGFKIKTKSARCNKGLGTGELDYTINAILSREFNKLISHVNLGYTYVGAPEGQNQDDVFSYAWALEYPFDERLNLVGELAGETNFEGNFDDNPLAVLLGLNCAFSDLVTFDLGASLGISNASANYALTTGLTISF